MTIRNYMNTQLAELAVMAKHLLAMDEELRKLRDESDWDWGDGLYVDLEIKVRTDAGELMGAFKPNDADGYDFWPSSSTKEFDA